jgi:16S rRNA (guanine527-N7)-methyltransferase
MESELAQLRLVAEWLDHPIDRQQGQALLKYADWLKDEALPAGGIGPDEAARVWDRHVCDSIVFAGGWPDSSPGTAGDLGSGVGLPGIPLSILWPGTRWTLIDRSGRRVELLRRAVRILSLGNVDVVQDDLAGHKARYEAIVARGVKKPQSLSSDMQRILLPGGRGAIGLSRTGKIRKDLPSNSRLLRVPPEVLDGGAEILIIEARER